MGLELGKRRGISRAVSDAEGMFVHRHPAVDGDDQDVQQESHREEREPRLAEVQGDERQQDGVGGEQEAGPQPVVRVTARRRHRDELEPQTEQGERPPPEIRLGQVLQGASEQ
jgi:hypothetical protein